MAKCNSCIHQYCCKYDRFFGVDEVENKCCYFKPTADVAKVKHGEWMPELRNAAAVWECSECKGLGRLIFDYCPHCGAKMYGKEDA